MFFIFHVITHNMPTLAGSIQSHKRHNWSHGCHWSGRGFQVMLWGNCFNNESKLQFLKSLTADGNSFQVFIHDPLYKWVISSEGFVAANGILETSLFIGTYIGSRTNFPLEKREAKGQRFVWNCVEMCERLFIIIIILEY